MKPSSRRATALLTVSVLNLLNVRARLHADSGAQGAAFLNIPVGAAPAAMGSAYSALAANAYAPVWNPAGLGFISGLEVAGQHLSYLESISYEFMSLVMPVGGGRSAAGGEPRAANGGLGISAQYLGTGDMTRTEIAPGDALADNGSFSSHWASYNVSYGQKVTERVSLGLTGKVIDAKIDDVHANAYAVDMGSLYKVADHVVLAATLANLGSKLTFLNDGDTLPLAFHIGGAYQPSPRALVSAEGVYEKNASPSVRIGTQWRPLEALALRVGYKTDTLKGLNAIAGLTAGLGLTLWGQEFAYAWALYGDLGNVQYFSFLIRFGKHAQEWRNLIHYQTLKPLRAAQGQERQDRWEAEQWIRLLQPGDRKEVAQTAAGVKDRP